MQQVTPDKKYDFIMVGSGAGGGPLAANLAQAGFQVLLLEAGTDALSRYSPVPIMQARASEAPEMTWQFFVRHYAGTEQQRRDSKFVPDRDGVMYPRGAALGGSTAVSAMINMYPHPSDWEALAQLTGNPDWSAEAMRKRFIRMERWAGPDADREHPARPGDESRHGFDGWLTVSRADPKLAGREPWFLDIIGAIEDTSRAHNHTPPEELLPHDPNAWPFLIEGQEGMAFVPVAVRDGARNGARERVLWALENYPDNLTIQYGALASRVLFEGKRAVGVEYLTGEHLSSSDALFKGTATQQVYCQHEVILCGGAFNTPQLLKLSGIGPHAELEVLGIPVLEDLPGVGENLQDRYEIGVTYRLKHDYPLFKGATLDVPLPGEAGDTMFTEWEGGRSGPYATNGTLASLIARSRGARAAGLDPDLYIFALPVQFRGYYPGYAAESAKLLDRLTILVLKGHTENRSGRVTLRSRDPRVRPEIQFHYFEEGNDTQGRDLEAVVDGIELARQIAGRLEMAEEELLPGAEHVSREALAAFVRDEAWGHHASCTCPIGRDDDPMAVLDGDFRVRGVQGLRVVDASVFPRIPGFFIAGAVYLVSERASDVLIWEYRQD